MELIEQVTILDKASRTLTQDDKALLVRFRLMSAETQNENKRVYPRQVLAKAVEDLKGRLAKRKGSFALNRHQDDEEVDDVSAVLEDVTMEGNDVFATARILPTEHGRNVQAIIRHGGSVGVSAKCYGAVDESGRVKPGLILKGFDWCLDPGFHTFASKANILESITVEDEDGAVSLQELEAMGLVDQQPVVEEVALKARYNFAVAAGCRLTFEQYKETLKEK